MTDDPALAVDGKYFNLHLGRHHAAGKGQGVVTHCITQGLGTIMSARHVVLVASGVGKAEAVHHMAEGAVSAMWPGTILQHHPHVTVLLDEGAASRLQLTGYYRETYAAKPAWQGL